MVSRAIKCNWKWKAIFFHMADFESEISLSILIVLIDAVDWEMKLFIWKGNKTILLKYLAFFGGGYYFLVFFLILQIYQVF